jgi:iodothyronine deiodinase-like protein
LYSDYKDRADFLTVYIREAHPLDEWQMKSNVDQGVCYAQPHSTEQRVAIANDFIQRFHFPVPFAVDDMHDIAEQGKIAYRGGIGPFNYHPPEARAWLEKRFGVTPSVPAATTAQTVDTGAAAIATR